MTDEIDIKSDGMTEKELNQFMSDMEAAEDNLDALIDSVGKRIAEGEELLPDELLNDNAWVQFKAWEQTDEGKWQFKGMNYDLTSAVREANRDRDCANARKAAQASLEARKKKGKLLSARKKAIARAALHQKEIHISDTLPREVVHELIRELTKDHTEMMDGLSDYINAKFTAMLRPLIPLSLQKCARNYPKSVRMCTGFMYRASQAYGKGICFWVTPKIPYYFTQGTEQAVAESTRPKTLFRVDKAIAQYDYHKRTRAAKEVAYAAVIVRSAVHTYYDLLRRNPFWFEKIYKMKTGKDLVTPKKNE